MCRERPWFTSLCGIPLRSWVMDLGILQLGLTLVITSLSVIKYIDTIDTCGQPGNTGPLCLGPVFKVQKYKMIITEDTIVVFSTQCLAPLLE